MYLKNNTSRIANLTIVWFKLLNIVWSLEPYPRMGYKEWGSCSDVGNKAA
jgi:hypothetical protein